MGIHRKVTKVRGGDDKRGDEQKEQKGEDDDDDGEEEVESAPEDTSSSEEEQPANVGKMEATEVKRKMIRVKKKRSPGPYRLSYSGRFQVDAPNADRSSM